MALTSVQSDIETLSRESKQPTPELGRDNTEAINDLASYLHTCDVGAHSALTTLMKFAVERGSASDGKHHWPIETLSSALKRVYDLDWSREEFWFALLEIAGMRLHTMSLNSPEIAFYEQQQKNDEAVLTSASPKDRSHYEKLKGDWRRHHSELDQLLMHRENVLLQREAVRQAFMRQFPRHLEEREQRLRLALAELKLDEIQKNPALSKEALDEWAEKELQRAANELQDDQRTMDYALTAESAGLKGFPSQKSLAEFRKRVKTLFMLLHPDRLLHVPLTDGQRRELRRLWDDCQGVNIRNASEYELARSRELIESCIERARAVLAQAGIDIDPGLIIQGISLEERAIWLQKAIHRTLRDIEIVRDELKAWRDDKEIAAMSALLSQSSEQQCSQHDEMTSRARDLAARAEAAEGQLSQLFATRRES